MINFQDVTKQYGSADPVLNKINFIIDRGSFAYLIGPTGSGKTTIFRLIIKDLLPSDGEITLGELDLSSLPKEKVPTLRRKVGVIFQDLKLLLDRTVVENVMLPLEFSGMGEPEARKKAEELLAEVGLSGKEDQFPAQLSGGERQRVAIARALIFDPDIILADEPTGNLDSKTSFQILDLLKSINKKGTTIFMATHNDKLINPEDRVIVLESGKVVEDRRAKAKPHEHAEKEKAHEKHTPEKKEEKVSETPKARSDTKIKLETLAEK
ncbi:MAG TPA: ATP-binding cassette domain-containing protein [Patescibacteria group bacterium]|nr:ATP-binding cassette domain-containing protein [Patescibacteria group bacterium]